MLSRVEKKNILRTSHFSWPEEFNMSSRYVKEITIDPSRSLEAWDRLSEDTFALEIASIPSLLHRAFRVELKKRARDER